MPIQKRLLVFGEHAATLPLVNLDEGDDITDLDDYVTVPSFGDFVPLVAVVDDAGEVGQIAARVDGDWYEVAELFDTSG